jgi:hypothetical protein
LNYLAQSAKGWRFRRPGETIQTGDLMPSGVTWEPVKDHLVGTEVMSERWSGGEGPELIICPRKRLLAARYRKAAN